MILIGRNELTAALDKYLMGEISRDELNIIIKKAYAHFLTHGFLSVDKLCLYPVFKGVLYAKDNTEVERFYDILNGKKNDVFHFRLTVPYDLPYKKFSAAYPDNDIIADHRRMMQISELLPQNDETDSLINEFMTLTDKYSDTKNIIGVLSLKISALFRQITDSSNRINELYPNRSAVHSDGSLTLLMQRYIQCAAGERAIICEAVYINGQSVLHISPDKI